jgi:ribosomal protein S27AE
MAQKIPKEAAILEETPMRVGTCAKCGRIEVLVAKFGDDLLCGNCVQKLFGVEIIGNPKIDYSAYTPRKLLNH